MSRCLFLWNDYKINEQSKIYKQNGSINLNIKYIKIKNDSFLCLIVCTIDAKIAVKMIFGEVDDLKEETIKI